MYDNNDQNQQMQTMQPGPAPLPGALPGADNLPPANPFADIMNPPAVVAVPMPEPTTSPVITDPIGAMPIDHTAPAGGNNDELLHIKQQALQQLSPLVSQLEQSPEEKFRTMMMMIQAADDHQLVQGAYEAAQAIPDEKARAQALLDVVNEINYFTQNKH